jgi:hypothetical protein
MITAEWVSAADQRAASFVRTTGIWVRQTAVLIRIRAGISLRICEGQFRSADHENHAGGKPQDALGDSCHVNSQGGERHSGELSDPSGAGSTDPMIFRAIGPRFRVLVVAAHKREPTQQPCKDIEEARPWALRYQLTGEEATKRTLSEARISPREF